MSIEAQVREVIIETLSVKPDEIKPDEALYDCLGVDSTEMVDLRVALEKRFQIKLDPKEITKNNTSGEIINLIENKKAVS